MIETLKNWLKSQIAIEWINNLILQTSTIILLLLIGYVLFLVGKFIILGLIAKLIKKTETNIDDFLIQHRIPHRIIQLIILAISHQINKSLFFSETVIYNLTKASYRFLLSYQ